MNLKDYEYWEQGGDKIYLGDVLGVLKSMPDESVQTCVTSPPYLGLRDYNLPTIIWREDKDCKHVWGSEMEVSKEYIQGKPDFARPHRKEKSFNNSSQFCQICGAWSGSLGLEPTPELYIKHMVEIFREVRRVLRKDGTLWLNMGDSYCHDRFANKMDGTFEGTDGLYSRKFQYMDGCSSNGPKRSGGIYKVKDLMGIPWRLALALQSDGWYLRSDIIWHKCLSGGVKVYARTQKGVLPTTLKDIYRLKPETVELWNGNKWTRLKEMTKQPRKGNEVEIVLRSGERISCTPEHRWPTNRGLKQASELKIGDIIDTCFLPRQPFPRNPKHLPDEIGWFVGIYLAEGSRDSGKTIQIASHKSEIDRYYKLQHLADDYGCTCRKHDTSENGMTICLDGKFLNAIIDTYISGKAAKDKHLSNACWQRSENFLKSLLDGYLDGDGAWDEQNKRWRLGFTRNYNLESDIRTLCSILGCNLTLNLSKSYIGSKKYDSFHGEIKFEAIFDGHWNQKNKGEILKIQKARARYFYDVTVEDEPHLFALASGILTHNSNPMPESVTDRPTKAHEYLFLLTKSAKYFYDADAIKENSIDKESYSGKRPRNQGNMNLSDPDNYKFHGSVDKNGKLRVGQTYPMRNKRTVWTIPTKPFSGAHFAVFPPALVEPCVLAGTSERGCCKCGSPWKRAVDKKRVPRNELPKDDPRYTPNRYIKNKYADELREGYECGMYSESKTIGWKPTCKCYGTDPFPKYPRKAKDEADEEYELRIVPIQAERNRLLKIFNRLDTKPCIVLDPFFGSGTTGIVADKHGRKFIGIELSKTYLDDIAIPRIEKATKQLKLW